MSDRPTDYELLRLREAMFAGGNAFDTGDPRQTPDRIGNRTGIHLVYLIDPDVRFGSKAAIEVSNGDVPAWLRGANPGAWEPVEWDELLDGRLGPWAMVVEGEQVLSICHTPVGMTAQAAEAGVRTEPQFRGRGHAAAATAAWAEVLRPSGRHLFYSASLDNPSSLRVVERLGARLIGWTWDTEEGRDGHADADVHPLSSLRTRASRGGGAA